MLRPIERTIDDGSAAHVDELRRATIATLTVRAPRRAAGDRGRDRRARRRVVAARVRARARRRAAAVAHERARAGAARPAEPRATRAVLAADRVLQRLSEHWLVRETIGLLAADVGPARRHLAQPLRDDRAGIVRSPGRCSSLRWPPIARTCSPATKAPLRIVVERKQLRRCIRWSPDGRRLATRFQRRRRTARARARDAAAARYAAAEALELGLVTVTPDDLDWDDELRLALEERAALSPDALDRPRGEPAIPGTRRRCGRRFSDGSRRGRTGSSSGRMPPVNEAPSNCLGAGSKPNFDEERV